MVNRIEIYNKLKVAIKEKRLGSSLRALVARAIVGERWKVIPSIRALYDGESVLGGGDYVRIASLELAAFEINSRGIVGDVAELGVYRGDFSKEINRVFPDRKLYLFDTFEGFDERDSKRDKFRGFSTGEQDFSDTSVENVLNAMPHRERIIIKKGWFPQTTVGVETYFVFVSIDADLYEPIYEGLAFFYPRLQKGGVLFVHDFNNKEYKGAREAVCTYCEEKQLSYFCIPDAWGTVVLLK